MEPLNVAFLWHQHQPNYKQPDQNLFILPWVRLHALKDYYDMVAILDDYPDIHQNINLVPSLIMQLEDYITGKGQDRIEILTKKKVAELTLADKAEMMKYFFQANWSQLVEPYPGYRLLLQKRGRQYDEKNSERSIKRFSDQDYLDLQVWYNLCWVGESHKQHEPYKKLIKKDHQFTEEDKQSLLSAQKEILKKILPKHRQLEERGQIELSTTPLFHPILPLLCDSEIARVSQADIQLPRFRFQFSADAREQVARAIDFHTNRFHRRPSGMWPSEGSVSEEVAQIFAQNQLQWIATDEEVLFHSWSLMNIQHKMTRENLYYPWRYHTPAGDLHIFFRDHALSDLIGFVYQNWEPEPAARDFVQHLKNIRTTILQRFGEPHLHHAIVSIILDGENCWEFFPQNGRPFLKALYRLLTESKELKSVTYREFLQQKNRAENLTRLYPGSWINHNFRIWIGHAEDNRAWDFLYQARQALAAAEQAKNLPDAVLAEVRNEIFMAEGSDWCWWYGDEHATENAHEFDQLFRSHLIRVYELLSQPVPVKLYEPIRIESLKKIVLTEPMGFIHPIIDGLESNYFEWIAAGVFDTKQQGSAMHQMAQFVEIIHYGFDLNNFYLKVVQQKRYSGKEIKKYAIELDIFEPASMVLRVEFQTLIAEQIVETILLKQKERWLPVEDGIRVAFNQFLEMSIPFAFLQCPEGVTVRFQIKVYKEEKLLEAWPKNGVICFVVPNSEFERIEWIV